VNATEADGKFVHIDFKAMGRPVYAGEDGFKMAPKLQQPKPQRESNMSNIAFRTLTKSEAWRLKDTQYVQVWDNGGGLVQVQMIADLNICTVKAPDLPRFGLPYRERSIYHVEHHAKKIKDLLVSFFDARPCMGVWVHKKNMPRSRSTQFDLLSTSTNLPCVGDFYASPCAVKHNHIADAVVRAQQCQLVQPKQEEHTSQSQCAACRVVDDDLQCTSSSDGSSDSRGGETQKFILANSLHREDVTAINDLLLKAGQLCDEGGPWLGKDMPASVVLLKHQIKCVQSAVQQRQICQIRYDPDVWAFAVQVLHASPRAYRILQKVMRVPHITTLKKYSRLKVSDGVGMTKATAMAARNTFLKLVKEDEQLQVVGGLLAVGVSFDAAVLRRGVYFDQNSLQVIGFSTKPDSVADCLSGYGNVSIGKDNLAKHCTVVMVQSLTKTRVAFPLGVYASSALNCDFVRTLVDTALTVLASAGLAVVCLVADGASENRKAFMNLADLSWKDLSLDSDGTIPENCEDFQFAFRHPHIENVIVFIISDPPHMLKKLRNAVLHSGVHDRATRLLSIEGDTMAWSQLVEVFNATACRGTLRAHRVPKAAMFPTSWELMRVGYAYRAIADPSWRSEVERYARERGKLNEYSRLLEFMEIVCQLWQAINCGDGEVAAEPAWRTHISKAFEYFATWKYSSRNDDEFIPWQCWADMQFTCLSFLALQKRYFPPGTLATKQLVPRNVSQDPCEQFFSVARNKSHDRNLDHRAIGTAVHDWRLQPGAERRKRE
jgi:hypothetical protein